MKLKELIPLLRFSGLHNNIFEVCMDIIIDDKEPKRIGLFSLQDYARISELEVVGISTYLTFTIWLKGGC